MLVGVNTIGAVPERSANRPGSHVDRYLRRTLQAIRSQQDETQLLLFTCPENHDSYEGWDRELLDESQGGFSLFRGGSALENGARKAKVDLLLTPLDNTPAGLGLPYVLYVPDLYDFELEAAKPGFKKSAQLKHARKICAQAQALVTPSEFLRRRCLEYLEAPLNKVIVAMPGVDDTFRHTFDTVVAKPYVVLFSDGLTAALVPLLTEALAQIAQEYPHTFVIAGPGNNAEPEDWGPRFVRIEQMPDNHLAGLYQNADVWIYAGLHDACGIRILEALRAGVPVLAPKTGALHEIVGDAPLYYNPTSPISLVQGIRRLLNDDEARRADRVHIGQKASLGYDWERTAWKMLTAFKRIG